MVFDGDAEAVLTRGDIKNPQVSAPCSRQPGQNLRYCYFGQHHFMTSLDIPISIIGEEGEEAGDPDRPGTSPRSHLVSAAGGVIWFISFMLFWASLLVWDDGGVRG